MVSTTLSPGRQSTKQVATAATVTIVGVAYFALIIIALHFIRPDLNPISQQTSAYAVGPYSFLMTSAFFSMSVATISLVIALYNGLPQQARSRIGLGLLGIWGVAVLIAMTFPIDLEGAPQTLSGTIHRINGPIAFLCVTLGVILVSWRFKQDEMWRPFHRTALVLSLILLVAFILGGLSIATQSGFIGLTQRIDLIALVTWMLLTAVRLRSLALTSGA